MQTYEYIVVTADNKIQRIIADSIKGVMEAIDEDESPVINIFRNNSVSTGGTYEKATVSATVYPPAAAATGCRAYPMLPVDTRQGEAVVLSCNAPEGWKLEGWYCKDEFIGTDEQTTAIVKDKGEVVYTARFTPSV